jgi:hypothetical protein
VYDIVFIHPLNVKGRIAWQHSRKLLQADPAWPVTIIDCNSHFCQVVVNHDPCSMTLDMRKERGQQGEEVGFRILNFMTHFCGGRRKGSVKNGAYLRRI